MPNWINLFSVAGNPVRGQVSSIDPAALGNGEWAALQNVRWSSVALKVRGGLSEYRATTGLASGTVVGAFFDRDTGDHVAVRVGSSVRVYKWDGTQWADVNASNRLGQVDRVFFEKYTMPDPGIFALASNAALSYSYLIVQDGVNPAQVYATSVDTLSTFAANSATAITPPNISRCDAVPLVFGNLNVVGTASTSITNSNTNTTITSGTITAGTVLNLNITTSTAASHNVIVPFSLGFTGYEPGQMQIVYNSVEVDIWDQFAIEVGDASNWYTIHLPGATSYQVATTGDRYAAALFDCSSVGTLGTSSTISDFISFPSSFTATRLRFTYVATAAPVAARTIPIYALVFTENVPFGTQFGLTFYNASTTVESAPAIATNRLPPALKTLRGTPLAGVTLAASPFATYGYALRYQEGAANLHAIPYARQGRSYTIVDQPLQVNTAPGELRQYTIKTLRFGRWTMPSATVTGIPVGSAMALNGDRLYVASNISGSSNRATRVAFSEKGMPNRFALLPEIVDGQVQPRSGGEALFGDETVTAIVPETSGIYAGEGNIVWTDKAVYQMGGVDAIQLSRPSNLGPYGTVSPDSIARFRNTLIWVTPEREVKSLGGDFGDLSSRQVEDVLFSVPAARLDDIQSTVFRERLYIGYTPSGESTNRNALVFDGRTNGWSIDSISTLSGASFAKWVPRIVNGETRLLCMSANGWTFEYDLPTATGDRYVTATTVVQPTVKLTSRTISQEHLLQFRLGQIMVTSDDFGDGVQWTTRLLERKKGATYSGVINLDGDGEKVWRMNRGATENARVGGIGLAMQVELEGQGLPDKAIYSIAVDAEPQDPNGADVK